MKVDKTKQAVARLLYRSAHAIPTSLLSHEMFDIVLSSSSL